MQYILTQEEMDGMKRVHADEIRALTETLQSVCTDAANRIPLTTVWGRNLDEPEPWGCVITLSLAGEEHVCDECPVKSPCPRKPKRVSK